MKHITLILLLLLSVSCSEKINMSTNGDSYSQFTHHDHYYWSLTDQAGRHYIVHDPDCPKCLQRKVDQDAVNIVKDKALQNWKLANQTDDLELQAKSKQLLELLSEDVWRSNKEPTTKKPTE